MAVAAMNGRDQVVRTLQFSGADINAVDATGATPLHFAARKGHESTVKLLLELSADAAVLDNQGKSAADTAAENGFTAIADLLASSVEPEAEPTP